MFKSLKLTTSKVTQSLVKNLVNNSCKYSSDAALKTKGDPKFDEEYNKKAIWACTEWDPLDEIILGRPDNAVIAPMCPEAKACLEPYKYPFYEEHGGKYWRDVVGEEMWKKMNDQVEGFAKLMEFHGVKVMRPDSHDFGVKYTTPTFADYPGHDATMARDHLLVVGDEIIESSMSWRYRYFEFIPYRNTILHLWRKGGNWTQAPKPTLEPGLIDEVYSESMTDAEKYTCVDRWVTTEKEPSWDAADFLRIGKDIIGQRSQATNHAGIQWLRRHVAPKGVDVHTLPIDLSMNLHIDVLISIVKPGLLMTNSDFKFKDLSLFTKAGWDIIPAPRPTSGPDDAVWKMTAAFPWLSMNTLYLDSEHVFVDESETNMIKFYEKYGIKAIPVPYKDTRWLGGGLHCWTCDTKRKGPMISYL